MQSDLKKPNFIPNTRF